MGHKQRVTKRDKKGRIRSSYQRVRIVVPNGLPPSLPAPYTGQKNLTKKVCNDREHAEWTARFLAMIDQARDWETSYRELAEIDGLSLEEFIRRGSIPPVFAKMDRKGDEIWGKPAWKEVTGKPITFEMIIPKWATHTDAPKKGVADMRSMAKRFANWLGHDDMARVRFENARDYRDARLAEIEAVMEEDEDFDPSGPRKTLSNHLKVLKALFNYAADNYPDDFPSGNPFARVKFDPGQGEKRATFTSEERARILTLARDSKDPIIKWCNLLAAYGGQRNEELADAHTRDIECIDGTWVVRLRMKHRTKDQRVKTKVSVRTMPVHSAVLAEGFIENYVQRLPDGPLFPHVALDGYGRRSGKITAAVNEWLHRTVGTDKTFYSHRHSFETFLRSASADPTRPCTPDVERYLMGHSSSIHAQYGDWLVPDLRAAIECIPSPRAAPNGADIPEAEATE